MTAASTLTPFDLPDAREAVKVAGRIQAQVEDDLRSASRALAEAERAYREALSETIVELHADGLAWSVCGDVARGSKRVAALRRDRDIAEGVLDATRQNAYRRGADRRDLSRLLNWSARRDLADDHAGQREPDVAQPTFGRQAA
ncbi:MAG: hypothetical protein AVDCRST_MAG68-2104 [uncultured Gemmatimonadetes bacterium]|uniref:Uncharacterized protein n=1 Tax=uncultured Gemmatimonadota bacterium TaxID=203437 RepID=A0A6J4L481_9BACT|nr:MAG: hypothetical protein AVDCRST_MAG68-2104 [uncultured Gemmatimonadota bacterium]